MIGVVSWAPTNGSEIVYPAQFCAKTCSEMLLSSRAPSVANVVAEGKRLASGG